MIAIIPSGSKTYEIYGDFKSDNLVEGKLYYHPETKRLYYYSSKETRSNPKTGYFPVWNGTKMFVSSFSSAKYLDKDAISMELGTMSKSISKSKADEILYNQRRADDDKLLKPSITDGDNSFTQCIKGTISAMNITMVDLYEMCNPKLDQRIIDSYYSSLTKISFMRNDKWYIWVNTILHIRYVITVYDDNNKKLITYSYPENKFDTGIVKYAQIVSNKQDDPLKKIVKLLMVMKNITKQQLLAVPGIDDYTINNMMTTLNGTKSLSSQIFSRFIRLTDLSYMIQIYDKDKFLFEYKE